MTTTTYSGEIDQMEQAIGGSMEFLRDMLEHAPEATTKFFSFMPLANHGVAAEVDALTVARMVALRAEDCGPCLQIAVNVARATGVDPTLIQTVLDERPEDLPPLLQRVYAFTRAVVETSPEADALGAALSEELGRPALVELALAVATIRVYPTLKRGLGYARSCAKVTVEV